MLTLTGVTKTFGDRRVLQGVDLAVAAGESVALVGANGSGKTTTLRCIAGLARPDRGRILIGGIDLARDPVRARRRISYLPQRSTFPATLTVRETLRVVAELRGLEAGAVDRELEACRLTGLADRNVGQLSGGEQQRLTMAVALLPQVDVYLFDEPSASLDVAVASLLVRRIRQLKREGRTLLFTTHSPADVRHLATRAVLLHDGRMESAIGRAFAPAADEFTMRSDLRRFERMLERDMWGDEAAEPAAADAPGPRTPIAARS
jgi:ABC-type multidrug transport system ATPase subunit